MEQVKSYAVKPIAYVESRAVKKYHCSKQPLVKTVLEHEKNQNWIKGVKGLNLEDRLDGIEQFSWIWVIFIMDRANSSPCKVRPPGLLKSQKKIGVFATRSPHRLNPIGISSVRLIKKEGANLLVEGGDWLDKTPVIDIKPYVDKVDAHESQEQGWLSNRLPQRSIKWHGGVQQALSLAREMNIWSLDLDVCEDRLGHEYEPSGSNRLVRLDRYLKKHPSPLPSFFDEKEELFIQSWGLWRLLVLIPFQGEIEVLYLWSESQDSAHQVWFQKSLPFLNK